MLYTTTQAAEEIADRVSVGPHRPMIYKGKIAALVRARRFTDLGTPGRAKIDRSEVDAFAADTRYVPDLSALQRPGRRVFVVSVRPRVDHAAHAEVVHHEHTGAVLRTRSGVDYALPPTYPSALGGWEGIWPIARGDAEDLCENGGLLMASCRGYVAPGHIRTVTGQSPVHGSARRYLHTAPAPAEVQQFLGTGIWIDLRGGGISHFLDTTAAATTTRSA